MSINIPANILSLKGPRINKVEHDEERQRVLIHCNRDRCKKVIDPLTSQQGRVNQYIKREVRDVPLFGLPCVLIIELAQVWIGKNARRLEHCAFVDKGSRYTKRFCRLVSGLCRHMSIQAVSRHLNIRWETVKNMT